MLDVLVVQPKLCRGTYICGVSEEIVERGRPNKVKISDAECKYVEKETTSMRRIHISAYVLILLLSFFS